MAASQMQTGAARPIDRSCELEKIGNGHLNGDRCFREIVDALPAAIYTTDAMGYITHFNPATVPFAGRTPELGRDRWCVSWKLYRPDGTSLPHEECPMAVALKEGRIIEGSENIIERPDGSRLWFAPYPRLLRDSAGRVTGGVNMLVDITDRKHAEQALRSSEQRLRTTLDAGKFGQWQRDREGCEIAVSASCKTHFGLAPDEPFTLQELRRAIHPDDLDRVIQSVEQAFDRLGDYEADYRCIWPDGEVHWINARGRVTGEGPSSRLFGVTSDITERKRAEEACSRLAAIVESSDDAIVSKDLNGIIQSWNTAAQRLFGYTAQEAVGQPVTMLFPADRIHEEPSILERIRRGERIEHYETVRRRKDGALLDVSLTISPIFDGHGRIVGASKIARDITERKQTDQALLDINKRLRHANLELQQFAYSASHDLQEPLRNVAVYSEMVHRRYAAALDADGREFLGFITSGARRLEMLIKDLLAYTRTASAPEEANETANAAEALESAISNLCEAIRESGAEITCDVLPEVRMREVELRQLFQNLLGNAIKYRRPEEAPRIHVSAERERGMWRIAVRDNGIGIAPEYLETVFGMFKRLHTDSEYPGTGMGLAICQKVVERHGGHIQVESEPGKGSAFIFTLPGTAAS